MQGEKKNSAKDLARNFLVVNGHYLEQLIQGATRWQSAITSNGIRNLRPATAEEVRNCFIVGPFMTLFLTKCKSLTTSHSTQKKRLGK